MGALALAAQIASVYFFSALLKTSSAWRADGRALEMALRIESFTYPFARNLLDYSALLKPLTVATWYLELLVPILFVTSIVSKLTRLGFISTMIFFHLVLACTFRLGVFPFVCIAGWCLWLPGLFWNQFSFTSAVSPIKESASRSNKVLGIVFQAACFYLLLFTLGINFKTTTERPIVISPFLNFTATFFQLWQKWGMFAPMPSIDDGWNRFEAILDDGKKVIINSRGGPADGEILVDPTLDRPNDLGASYRSVGWRTFLYSLQYSETSNNLRSSYLEYLCHRFSDKNPDLTIQSIDFSYNVEWTKQDLSKGLSENVFISNHPCAN